MSEYNAKNYTEQGGDTTHFGGKVIFEEGCEVEGGSFTEVKTASETDKGIAKIGDGLSIDSEGELSVTPAADDTLGGVIVGDGLAVEEDGTLSVAEATKTVAGGVLAVDDLEDCEATDVAGINAFLNNYLLVRLRTAGILKE